ncbi:MAG: NAD(P)/FAD-dependent oxidoreductase [Rhodospirillales bacterium]|nr:NAD(P)/FAD-dependent oxidoreductase [Rhodospirillales bacterium]
MVRKIHHQQGTRPIYDVIIIGAGAAGLMAAITCGRRGRRTLVLERSPKPAEKIRISGGGRCNFTNLHTSPANFISNNPRFCISALKQYDPHRFIELVNQHGIAFHEKKLGQLFCDGASTQIIQMLLDECRKAGVEIRLGVEIAKIEKPSCFRITTGSDSLDAGSVVIASGGKSIPKMGATSFGYEVASQFGLNIVAPEPALVPLTFDGVKADQMKLLAGVSADAEITCRKTTFAEALLFTHRGLSGPAILQISSYWRSGEPIVINLLPGTNVSEFLLQAKQLTPQARIPAVLSGLLATRLITAILAEFELPGQLANTPNKTLKALGQRLNAWQLVPSGSEGYRTAEVTRGGVDTAELSSKTMAAKTVPGLYFIGEVVDVTGHLGGFNFQWAWSSGYAAGQHA